MDQLSSDPENSVIGIIRNKPPTVERVASELADRKNLTLLEADLTNHEATKKAAVDAGEYLGSKLDILIANAGYVPQFDAYDGIRTLCASKSFSSSAKSRFHAQYAKEGVLFMGVCLDMVEITYQGHRFLTTPEQMEGLHGMLKKFAGHAPSLKSPDTPHDSIKAVLKVVDDSTVQKDGGAFLSHFGNKQWI